MIDSHAGNSFNLRYMKHSLPYLRRKITIPRIVYRKIHLYQRLVYIHIKGLEDAEDYSLHILVGFQKLPDGS
jgi:hypothetical protein